jgi:hypothetical protein
VAEVVVRAVLMRPILDLYFLEAQVEPSVVVGVVADLMVVLVA